MKIWGEISKISEIYKNQKSVGKVEQSKAVVSKKDMINISDKARDFQTVVKAVKDIPDIRQSKVDEISKKIENSSYDIKGKEVADKIVNSMFDKKI